MGKDKDLKHAAQAAAKLAAEQKLEEEKEAEASAVRAKARTFESRAGTVRGVNPTAGVTLANVTAGAQSPPTPNSNALKRTATVRQHVQELESQFKKDTLSRERTSRAGITTDTFTNPYPPSFSSTPAATDNQSQSKRHSNVTPSTPTPPDQAPISATRRLNTYSGPGSGSSIDSTNTTTTIPTTHSLSQPSSKARLASVPSETCISVCGTQNENSSHWSEISHKISECKSGVDNGAAQCRENTTPGLEHPVSLTSPDLSFLESSSAKNPPNALGDSSFSPPPTLQVASNMGQGESTQYVSTLSRSGTVPADLAAYARTHRINPGDMEGSGWDAYLVFPASNQPFGPDGTSRLSAGGMFYNGPHTPSQCLCGCQGEIERMRQVLGQRVRVLEEAKRNLEEQCNGAKEEEESMRQEMELLRQELGARDDRVKALESEVHTLTQQLQAATAQLKKTTTPPISLQSISSPRAQTPIASFGTSASSAPGSPKPPHSLTRISGSSFPSSPPATNAKPVLIGSSASVQTSRGSSLESIKQEEGKKSETPSASSLDAHSTTPTSKSNSADSIHTKEPPSPGPEDDKKKRNRSGTLTALISGMKHGREKASSVSSTGSGVSAEDKRSSTGSRDKANSLSSKLAQAQADAAAGGGGEKRWPAVQTAYGPRTKATSVSELEAKKKGVEAKHVPDPPPTQPDGVSVSQSNEDPQPVAAATAAPATDGDTAMASKQKTGAGSGFKFGKWASGKTGKRPSTEELRGEDGEGGKATSRSTSTQSLTSFVKRHSEPKTKRTSTPHVDDTPAPTTTTTALQGENDPAASENHANAPTPAGVGNPFTPSTSNPHVPLAGSPLASPTHSGVVPIPGSVASKKRFSKLRSIFAWGEGHDMDGARASGISTATTGTAAAPAGSGTDFARANTAPPSITVPMPTHRGPTAAEIAKERNTMEERDGCLYGPGGIYLGPCDDDDPTVQIPAAKKPAPAPRKQSIFTLLILGGGGGGSDSGSSGGNRRQSIFKRTGSSDSVKEENESGDSFVEKKTRRFSIMPRKEKERDPDQVSFHSTHSDEKQDRRRSGVARKMNSTMSTGSMGSLGDTVSQHSRGSSARYEDSQPSTTGEDVRTQSLDNVSEKSGGSGGGRKVSIFPSLVQGMRRASNALLLVGSTSPTEEGSRRKSLFSPLGDESPSPAAKSRKKSLFQRTSMLSSESSFNDEETDGPPDRLPLRQTTSSTSLASVNSNHSVRSNGERGRKQKTPASYSASEPVVGSGSSLGVVGPDGIAAHHAPGQKSPIGTLFRGLMMRGGEGTPASPRVSAIGVEPLAGDGGSPGRLSTGMSGISNFRRSSSAELLRDTIMNKLTPSGPDSPPSSPPSGEREHTGAQAGGGGSNSAQSTPNTRRRARGKTFSGGPPPLILDHDLTPGDQAQIRRSWKECVAIAHTEQRFPFAILSREFYAAWTVMCPAVGECALGHSLRVQAEFMSTILALTVGEEPSNTPHGSPHAQRDAAAPPPPPPTGAANAGGQEGIVEHMRKMLQLHADCNITFAMYVAAGRALLMLLDKRLGPTPGGFKPEIRELWARAFAGVAEGTLRAQGEKVKKASMVPGILDMSTAPLAIPNVHPNPPTHGGTLPKHSPLGHAGGSATVAQLHGLLQRLSSAQVTSLTQSPPMEPLMPKKSSGSIHAYASSTL